MKDGRITPQDLATQQKEALKQQRQALIWLEDLSKKTPLGAYLKKCLVCERDSEAKLRCKKHKNEYSEVFFETPHEFLAIFKDQL